MMLIVLADLEAEAEASLVRAYHTAEGLALAGPSSFMRLMSLMLPTLGSSSIRRLPQYFGFVAGSNRSVSSKASGLMGLPMRGCLHSGTGWLLSRRWDPLVPLPRLNLGLTGSLQITMGLTSGLWTPVLYSMSLY